MKSRSSPSPRRSDWKAWQCALTVPGRSAFPGSRVMSVAVASADEHGPTSVIRPSRTVTISSLNQRPSTTTTSGRSRIRTVILARLEFPDQPGVNAVVELAATGDRQLHSHAEGRARQGTDVEARGQVELRPPAELDGVFAFLPLNLAHRVELEKGREPAREGPAHGEVGRELLLAGTPDIVQVPLVGDGGDHVEGAQADPARHEGLDGDLAAQAPALRAARQTQLESAGDEHEVLDRFPQEELVLKLEVARPRRRGRIVGVPIREWHLDFDLPPRRDGPLESARELARAALTGLRVLEARFQLALDDGPTRDDGIEELDLWLLVGARGNREEQEGGHERAGMAQGSSFMPEQPPAPVAGWRRRRRSAGWLVRATSSGSACLPW